MHKCIDGVKGVIKKTWLQFDLWAGPRRLEAVHSRDNPFLLCRVSHNVPSSISDSNNLSIFSFYLWSISVSSFVPHFIFIISCLFICLAVLGLHCGRRVSLLELAGFSSCGTRAKLSCGMRDLISLTRDWTHIPSIARQSLNHWVTRKDPVTVY